MGDDVSEPLSPSRAGGTLVDCFPDAIVTLLVNTINKQANTPAYINTAHTPVRLDHGWRCLSQNNQSKSRNVYIDIDIFLYLESIIDRENRQIQDSNEYNCDE